MRLVLIGGGLGHLHFIRSLHQENLGDTEIVLINPRPHVFYRPAFSSVLNGTCRFQEASIDLRKISTLAGVTFIQDDVEFIHKEKKIVKFANRASVQFDYLSIDDVEGEFNQLGSAEHIFYVKNFIEFFKRLEELEKGVRKLKPNPFQVAVVGGGRLSVELSLFFSDKLKIHSPKMQWEIFEQQSTLLPDHHPQIRKRIEKALKKKDILFHTQFKAGDVSEHLVKCETSNRSFDADVVLACVEASLPKWMEKSELPIDEEGLIESHPDFTLKTYPYIMAGDRLAGSLDPLQDARSIALNLLDLIKGRALSCKKAKHSDEKSFFDLPNKKTLSLKWGFAAENEKLWVYRQERLAIELEHLRGLKEQKTTRLLPTLEDNTFIEKLKNRLILDVNPKSLDYIFSEKLENSSHVDQWCEREYKDVFNDHYLSSFHTGLDILDQGFTMGGVPRYLRLYVSSPRSMRDVEILSQIIVGAYRSVRDHCEFRVHVCSQAMNTVQFSLGTEVGDPHYLLPEPVAYIALTQPLGLYGLLSQQGKDVWEGQWLSDIWKNLEQTHSYLPEVLKRYREYIKAIQLKETGLVNNLVEMLGEEGWRICLNLRNLPRWPGVDYLLKQKPNDSLLERNWQKGFRYWTGHGERMPDSQYLLWEPHVVRPTSCLLVDPSIARELRAHLKKNYGIELTYVGYAEKGLERDQTLYKFSDWELGQSEEQKIESPRQLEL